MNHHDLCRITDEDLASELDAAAAVFGTGDSVLQIKTAAVIFNFSRNIAVKIYFSCGHVAFAVLSLEHRGGQAPVSPDIIPFSQKSAGFPDGIQEAVIMLQFIARQSGP